MSDYISREAAMAYAPLPKNLRNYQTGNLDDAWEDGYDFAISQISNIPPADVRPVVNGRAEALARFNKKTNADRIRAMSDEEFAEWINYICDAYYAPDCGWLKWLQQEVNDE